VGCRLVVRRVARLGEHAKQGQDELFTSWRYHGFVTNSTLSTVQADERHRDHAIVEQVIAELKDGPLAHAPFGEVHRERRLAHPRHDRVQPDAGRRCRRLPRHARARWATLRSHLIAVPARIATSARRLVLHLPRDWPWQPAWQDLWATATHP